MEDRSLGLKIRTALRFAGLALLLSTALAGAARAERIAGVVVDPGGAPVAGAAVSLAAAGGGRSTTTDRAGRFVFADAPADAAALAVAAPGYARAERRVSAGEELRVVLSPALAETLTVTATRTERRLADTAASVVVITADDLAASASPALDDALRQVPGFSLFRRSGSRFANPTSQGVSLRGLGASGTSRAVVLDDGIPLNDPFGGWVYWARVPREAIARVEVMRGAASDLYGSAALGGAIQLVERGAARPQLAFESSYGERRTPEASLFLAGRQGAWGASLAAESFATNGYVTVDPAQRGAVDTPMASRHSALAAGLERALAGGGRAFLRGSLYDEDRDNGTPLQTNDTRIRQAGAGADWSAGAAALSLRAWAGDQTYHQSFSSIAADRASERLIRLQTVPADAAGLSAQATRAVGARHALLAGIEVRAASGTSEEQAPAGNGFVHTAAGGRQHTEALFVEDLVSATPRLSLTLGGRFDRWSNVSVRPAAGAAPPERSESAFSPRASLLFRASPSFSLTAAAYRAFRAPTLNELYRSFRLGNVNTLANPDLHAERLTGGEAGVLAASPGGRVSGRATLFSMEVDQTIANVTLSAVPSLITRRRENLGRTRSRGVEAEVTARAGARWTLSAGYLLSDARVARFPADRTLEGLRLPQVPRQQATFQAQFAHPALGTVALQARWVDEQFDDDRNQFPLRSFATVDLTAARPLPHGFAAFVAGENLLDRGYEIGRTPTRTLGSPRLLRAGLRWRR
jgi:iron complex outermembrane recepter protein